MGNKNVCYSGYLWCVCLCNTHLQKKNLNGILLFLGISSTLLYLLNHVFLVSDSKNIINALRFTSMFFIGASAFILKDKIILSYRIAILISICILFIILAGKNSAFFVVYGSLIFYLVLYASYLPSGSIRLFNKLGDYSYGMYIYGFPVQQSIAAFSTNYFFCKNVGDFFSCYSCYRYNFLALHRKTCSKDERKLCVSG